MAFIVSHFDDSGTHPESTIAVAACILASEQQWTKFSKQWKRILDKEHVGAFHTADFASGQGNFKGWDWARKRRVLNALCGIAVEHSRCGWSRAVQKRDYDRMIQDPLRLWAGRFHYTFCVRQCAGEIERWGSRRQRTDWGLKYVFDRMSYGKGEIIDVLNAAPGLSDYIFADKSHIVPLQGADIFAWATLQKMHEMLSGRKLRAEAQIILDHLTPKFRAGYFAESNLREWAAAESAELAKRLSGQPPPVTAA